jgi:hypothetical protein
MLQFVSVLPCFVPCLAVVAILSISNAAFAADLFGPIRIGANRSKYVGARPVNVLFTGNINLNSPHPQGFSFNYYWVRSDGAKGPVNVCAAALPPKHVNRQGTMDGRRGSEK